MPRKLSSVLFSILFFLASVRPASAIYDPLSVPNNRFGVHIFSEKDLEDAAALVNSSGGDWGYVTFVITEGERDHDRWQHVFDKMRKIHLIPIVRVATKPSGDTWEKPKPEEVNNWITFFNSLNWVVENRYIVIGNEPNLDNEWGGSSNPGEYAAYLREFSTKLKTASPDYFVLPAGLAPDPGEFRFMKNMLKSDPKIFEAIDGWTSHSYPTASISLYRDELDLIGKDLPVFITETGWSNKKLNEQQISQNLVDAYNGVWSDSKIVAVTPFILDYTTPPFAEFSWKSENGSFFIFYKSVQDIVKQTGAPIQIVKGQILAAFAQPLIVPSEDFFGVILAKNTGQSIWTINQVVINSDHPGLSLRNYFFDDLEPLRTGLIIFKATAPPDTGIYSQSVFLSNPKGFRVTNSFLIEAAVVRMDKMQVDELFGKISSYLRGVFSL